MMDTDLSKFKFPIVIEKAQLDNYKRMENSYNILLDGYKKEIYELKGMVRKYQSKVGDLYSRFDFQPCLKHGEGHVLAMCVYCVDDNMEKLREQIKELKELATRTHE